MKMVRCKIKVNNKPSEPFKTKNGLRRRDSLPCILYNMALEIGIQATGTEKRSKIYNKSLKMLAYTDDTDNVENREGS
jgi:hypothetical protein